MPSTNSFLPGMPMLYHSMQVSVHFGRRPAGSADCRYASCQLVNTVSNVEFVVMSTLGAALR